MEWLIPCNPKKYDVITAFSNLDLIDWRQNNNIISDDIVYIYVSKPFQQIMFKTLVIQSDIPYDKVNLDDSKYNLDSFLSEQPSKRYMRLKLLDYFNDDYLKLNQLIKNGLPKAPQGAMRLTCKLKEYIGNFEFNNNYIFSYQDTIIYTEGSKTIIQSNKYERNLTARKRCIEANGCYCHICGLSFEDKYGEIGKDFIHVHHKIPLSKINKEYVVNPINDLLPVCPNCHAILHRKVNGKYLSIEELRNIIKT